MGRLEGLLWEGFSLGASALFWDVPWGFSVFFELKLIQYQDNINRVLKACCGKVSALGASAFVGIYLGGFGFNNLHKPFYSNP